MTDSDRFQELDEPLAEDRQADSDGSGEEADASGVETPRAEVPTTKIPETPVPSTRAAELEERATDVDPTFKALFWKLVLLYKLGLIGLTIGVLLLASGLYPARGQLLTAGSVGLLLYAAVLTYQGKARLDAGEFDLDTGGDDREAKEPVEEPSP